MAGINLNKKIMAYSTAGAWSVASAPGLPTIFDVPVKLVRIPVVLSIFFGLALFTTGCLHHFVICA